MVALIFLTLEYNADDLVSMRCEVHAPVFVGFQSTLLFLGEIDQFRLPERLPGLKSHVYFQIGKIVPAYKPTESILAWFDGADAKRRGFNFYE